MTMTIRLTHRLLKPSANICHTPSVDLLQAISVARVAEDASHRSETRKK